MSNEDALVDAKRRISSEYLGREHIHGVGVSRTESAVRVYIDSGAILKPEVLAAIERLAEPFAVLVVDENPPTLA